MQYFNVSNSEVEFISDILRTNYIPTIRIFNSHKRIQPIATVSWVTDGLTEKLVTEIPEIVTSEQLPMNAIADLEDVPLFQGESIILDDTIRVIDKNREPIVKRYIDRYEFGKRYPNITTNYINNKFYYSSDLHERLGRYLRAYRDYYGVDVMNFYNCFSNRYFTTFSLPINRSIKGNPAEDVILTAYDSNYKLIAFPILFDTQYRVKFYGDKSITGVKYQAAYFNGEVPLGAVEIENNLAKVHDAPPGPEFTITIGSKQGDDDTEEDLEDRLSRQNLLYLFLQYPATADGPLVILEQAKFTNAVNNELLNLPQTIINKKQQVAFSDTLLEYLTGNAISPASKTHRSIHKIQQVMANPKFKLAYGRQLEDYTSGVFDEKTQRFIYNTFFKTGLSNFIGCIDKAVEPYIDKVGATLESIVGGTS